MTRNEFLKKSMLAGIGATFLPSLLTSCKEGTTFYNDFEVNFNGKVLIIGAGAAGITAGYILNKYNIDFEILEASSVYGGRIKEIKEFADFPIDLGAEWIHTDPSILAKLINDNQVRDKIDIIKYTPETLYLWKDKDLKKRNFFTNFYGEHKFKSTTWYNFFEKYFIPEIEDKINLNSPVNKIDYSGNQIIVENIHNDVFQANKLILTVPLTILKNNYIDFTPPLPNNKITALENVDMPDGIKVFIQFSEKFYPDLLGFGGLSDLLSDDTGEKLYYNAAFRKDTDKNILGLFTVGNEATEYTQIPTEQELINHILKELDEIFDGKASQKYMNHVVQNWSNEPFIAGSYSHYDNDGDSDILGTPIDDKIFFAGEAYANDLATVHGAAESAYTIVEEILKYN